jgi:class 3 adenylate cyclase
VLVALGGLSQVLWALFSEGPGLWLSVVLGLIGMVGLAAIGQWLEAHWYARISRRGLAARLVAGTLTPLLAFAVVLVALLVLGGAVKVGATATNAEVSGDWLISPLLFVALWFSGASVGSALVLAINEGVSWLIQSFRARVLTAVLLLLALTTLGNVAVITAAMLFIGAVARKGSEMHMSVGITGWQQLTGETLRSAVLDHPALTGLVFFALGFLLALPVVVSACLRLAEAVMERLRPLSKALEMVGAGTRAVRLEEAGSRDFIEVSQRFNQMVMALERSERMERAFGVYVSGQVLELIRAQHGEAAIPAALRDASVFFADIRGFTSLSERLSPEAVVGFLNRYFARVVQVVDRHQGYLNKFIGDAVVVVFNGPMDQPDHAARAMHCALELQAEVRAMNEARAFPELGELRVGVGIATGPMVCGNIGSPTQMEYTVIGDTVNLSARLTSHAGATEVWASEASVANLPVDLQATALEPIKVKGKEKPVTPFRVTRRS